MGFLDTVIVAAYVLTTLAIGVAFCRRGSRSMGDFFLSGRTLPF